VLEWLSLLRDLLRLLLLFLLDFFLLLLLLLLLVCLFDFDLLFWISKLFTLLWLESRDRGLELLECFRFFSFLLAPPVLASDVWEEEWWVDAFAVVLLDLVWPLEPVCVLDFSRLLLRLWWDVVGAFSLLDLVVVLFLLWWLFWSDDSLELWFFNLKLVKQNIIKLIFRSFMSRSKNGLGMANSYHSR